LRLRRPFARRALVLTLVVQGTVAVVTASPVRAASAVTFTPIADTLIRSDKPAVNFGSADRIGADSSPKTKSFLRFDVAGLSSTPTGARLRLWVTDKSSNAPEVHAVDGPWDESTLTYDTRPPVRSAVVDDHGSVSAGRWLEYDVGKLVTGNGLVDLALIGDSSDGTDFASREDAEATGAELDQRGLANHVVRAK